MDTYELAQQIADQFNRLRPSDVDLSLSGNGEAKSGYSAWDTDDDTIRIGYSYEGGNCGHPILDIPQARASDFAAYLVALPDGALDNDLDAGGWTDELSVVWL